MLATSFEIMIIIIFIIIIIIIFIIIVIIIIIITILFYFLSLNFHLISLIQTGDRYVFPFYFSEPSSDLIDLDW